MGDIAVTQGNQGWTKRPPARLEYDQACVYRADADIEDFWHGYQYLDNFDVVCFRLGKHELSAIQLDGGQDYDRCVEDLPTMRLPPLDASVVWMRRSKATSATLKYWRQGVDDWNLALLRAVYLARPYLYLFPADCFEQIAVPAGDVTLWATRDLDDWAAAVYDGDILLWRSAGNQYRDQGTAIDAARVWAESERGI